MMPAPCPGGSGIIGGKVFGDFNYNGLDDQVSPLPDVKVYLFGCDGDGTSVLLDTGSSLHRRQAWAISMRRPVPTMAEPCRR